MCTDKIIHLALKKWLNLSLVIFLFAGGTLSLSGCWHQPEVKTTPVAAPPIPADAVPVFFSKYQGSQSILAYVVRKLPANLQASANKSKTIEYALQQLLKGPSQEEKSQGFYSEIPAGTVLRQVAESPKTLTVDLSKPFATGGGSNSMIQRLNQLKETVKAQDNQHALKVTVDGKSLETLGGEGLEVPGTLESSPE